MTNRFKTEQESFWAGDFGTEYAARNQGPRLLASNLAFFSRTLRRAGAPSSCMEFGANIGINLKALKLLFPLQQQFALEINPAAAGELRSMLGHDSVFEDSILSFAPPRTFDLVLVKGVLIHVNPDSLPQAYDALHRSTGRHLLLCEYYNPVPVEVSYRGHTGRLFKRDFCGDMLDRYPDLHLVDYGFVYHRDPKFPQDDLSWFLLERRP